MTTSAERRAIGDVGSPVLLTPDAADQDRPWRWTTLTIALCAALLLLVNAHAIGEWFDALTPGPLTEPLRRPVERWTSATAAAGLDAPRAALHRRWERLRDLRFGTEQPGQRGAAAGGS